MEKVVADDVPTANVLWMAAERIGKTSSNGDEVQRICDYLVNKHWFQTAGDLRMAQLATEEWHSLQIPSRLKIAVQQVLDDVKYTQESVGYGYDQQYHCAADGSVVQQQGYEGYYYGHDGSTYSAAASSEVSSPTEAYEYQYSGFSSASSGGDTSYAGDKRPFQSQPMETTEAEYASESYASDQDVVGAHAVVVEDAASYEEILALMARHGLPPLQSQPQEWSYRQCTYLNPMTESFCEMCTDHISMLVPSLAVSPAAATGATMTTSPLPSYAFNASEVYALKSSSESPPPPAAAVVTPPSTVSLVLRHILQAGGASLKDSTPLLSPLYAPSAPTFDDDMAYEDWAVPSAVVIAPSPLSPPLLPSAARQLAFQAPDDGSPTVLIHPTKVVLSPPPPPQADFLALAFNKKPASDANDSSPMAAKRDQVRRSADAACTYSFYYGIHRECHLRKN